MSPSQVLAAEIFERAIRIHGLVQRATRPLLAASSKITAQIVSADRIKSFLKKLVIDELAEIYKGNDSEEAKVDQLRALMEVVAIIHEGTLPTVPRIVEPIELHSYLRQGSRWDNIPESKTSKTLVFATERLGMQVYPNSLAGLLEKFAKRHKLEARARHYSSDIAKLAIARLEETIDPYEVSPNQDDEPYVAIPAVDVHNPTRWPSLWHEIGHHELQKADVLNKFIEHVNGSSENSHAFDSLCIEAYQVGGRPREDYGCELSPEDKALAKAEGEYLLSHWLRECWCDAYGVRQAGLGFLYSQLHDFMFCWPSYLASSFIPGQPYPPAWFRLRLSRNLAIERLNHQNNTPDKALVEKLVTAYKVEEKTFLGLAPARSETQEFKHRFANIYSHFLAFLKSNINFGCRDVLAGDISGAAFEDLEDDLRVGLPIPSIVEMNSNVSRAAQVSEIVLAGWRTRNTSLRKELLAEFEKYCSGTVDSAQCVQHCIELIDRSDDSVKRSIQVAEWFSILSDGQHVSCRCPDERDKKQQEAVEDSKDEQKPQEQPGLISDEEIKRLLHSDGKRKPQLRVIPLINCDKQINGTVVDVRLGHNFEIFQSVGQHAIDACDESADSRIDSVEAEVDFLEGLHILPGQFVLGHTLEYIKLPGNVAAQIEGRSSFARLGIQVHMTANLVEAGFEGCLTLEIHNSGPSTVVLYPGMRLAQLRFFRITGVASGTYSRPGNKYHGQLGQNRTKQFKDPEVEIFRRCRKMRLNS